MIEWLNNCVFYEVYPSSFYDSNGDGMGDINGITEKLDYIKQLGCDAVWLNPCYKSAFKDGGYDIIDHKTVDERFGTNDDLVNLFAAAHKKGMRIVLDLVPGHTSDRHSWFLQSCLPQKNEFTNRYIWTGTVYELPEKFRSVNGTTDRDGNYIVNYFSSQPALNYGFAKSKKPWQLHFSHSDCQNTQAALLDIMEYWLDLGCDGFRVDMAQYLIKNDRNCKENIKLWQNIFARIKPKYPQAAFISEWFNFKQSFAAGFHADFYNTYGYLSFIRTHLGETTDCYFNPEGKTTAVKFFEEFNAFYKKNKGKGYMSLFTGNHDFARLNAYDDPVLHKIALACLLTLPGLPFVYYGDEIGLKQNFDLFSKEGGYYRTGARTPMQWDNTPNSGFSQADSKNLFLPVDTKLNPQSVESCMKQEDSFYYVARNIIQMRKKYEALSADGPFEIVYLTDEHPSVIYKRGEFTFLLNTKNYVDHVPVNLKLGELVFSIGTNPECGEGICMPQKSFCIYRNI